MFPAQALAEAMLRKGGRVRLSTDARGARYIPWRLLLSRLTAPLGTIHCRRGRSDDLVLPADPLDSAASK